MSDSRKTVVVVGGTGTVGSRVTAQLRLQGAETRPVSRSSEVRFDWDDDSTWGPALAGGDALFLLLPEDRELDPGFLTAAMAANLKRVVLLSDHGVDVMPVERLQQAESLVQHLPVPWTILRPDWFNQDFETFFRRPIIDGQLFVPVGDIRQAFVDADDIAAVAVAALTGDGHAGATYEVNGPEPMTFTEALDLISTATGQRIVFDGTSDGYRRHAAITGLDKDVAEAQILSWSRLKAVGDVVPSGSVERTARRPGRQFAAYVNDAAARGVWTSAEGGQ